MLWNARPGLHGEQRRRRTQHGNFSRFAGPPRGVNAALRQGHRRQSPQRKRKLISATLISSWATVPRGSASRQYGKAEEHYRKAIAIDGGNATCHSDLGFALTKLGRYEEALEYYRKALSLDSSFTAAHFNLGLACQELGRPDEAVAHYLDVLRLDPNDSKTHNNLGNALMAVGKLDQAIPHFEEASGWPRTSLRRT